METKSRPLYREAPVPMWRTLLGWVVFVAVIVGAYLLQGCSSAPIEAGEDAAARGVNAYCSNFPYEIRKGVIAPRFNDAIAPHRATINCHGDPENPHLPANDAGKQQ